MTMHVLVPKDDDFKLGYSIRFDNVILARVTPTQGHMRYPELTSKSSYASLPPPLQVLPSTRS